MEKDYGGQNNQEPLEEFLDALEVVYQKTIEDYSKLASRYGLSIKEVQCFNGKLVKYMLERQRPDSAYKSFDYRGLDSLRNYYSTCMKYGLIRIAKQQEAESLDENDKYDHLLSEIDQFQWTERPSSLLPILDELSASSRDIFQRKVDYDYTHEEIADELRISEEASRKNYSRTIQKIKARIELPIKYQGIYKECICGKLSTKDYAQKYGITEKEAKILLNGTFAYIYEHYLSNGG